MYSSAAWTAVIFLAGCVTKHEDTRKLRNLDFTVLNPEDAPQELREMIGDEEKHPFRLVYADQGILYISRRVWRAADDRIQRGSQRTL